MSGRPFLLSFNIVPMEQRSNPVKEQPDSHARAVNIKASNVLLLIDAAYI